MSMTDPIADMLTRIRNANGRRKPKTLVPYSNLKVGALEVLKSNGYIDDFKTETVEGRPFEKVIVVYLRYTEDGDPVINELKRVSKPGRRIFRSVTELKKHKVLDGLGMAVVSTSKGIKSDSQCKAEKVGGEVLCTVW